MTMIALKVRYPGALLRINDRAVRGEIEAFIYLLQDQLGGAVTAFNFREFARREGTVDEGKEGHRFRESRRMELTEAIARDLGTDPWTGPQAVEIQAEADARLRCEEWYSRHLRWSDWHRLSLLCTHAYVFALHTFREVLVGLSEHLKARGDDIALQTEFRESRSRVASALNEFDALFPDLKDARDSLHHFEDRGRGLEYGRPLNLPIQLGGGTILNLGSSDAGSFSIVTRTGHDVRIAVDPESLEAVAGVLNGVMQGFAWDGPIRLHVL